jgi:hypothetical protein
MSPARLTLLLLLASAVMPSVAETPPLGRLFLDPQQRARLDAQRQRNPAFLPDAGDSERKFDGERKFKKKPGSY